MAILLLIREKTFSKIMKQYYRNQNKTKIILIEIKNSILFQFITIKINITSNPIQVGSNDTDTFKQFTSKK